MLSSPNCQCSTLTELALSIHINNKIPYALSITLNLDEYSTKTLANLYNGSTNYFEGICFLPSTNKIHKLHYHNTLTKEYTFSGEY
jgi:hypothetical protein